MSELSMTLAGIQPTCCLRGEGDGLRQLVRVTVDNAGAPGGATLTARVGARSTEWPLPQVPSGPSEHEVFLPEITHPQTVEFALQAAGQAADCRTLPWQPPRRWTVHVVQRSHHDVGYTNLPSAVLREHCGFLDQALDFAQETEGFPPEAQFRLLIEQAWSLVEFLRQAPPDRTRRMLELLRAGRLEVTALFGNLTTELCGAETLARALYPAFRLKREYGIPLTSAEHNDVPGMSWGLCQVLTDAGIRFFAPALPNYYGWSELPLQTFWDQATLFPRGLPGGFWWEAPSGRRLLLWYGDAQELRPSLPELEERLRALEAGGYPYPVLRLPVSGAARDNPPYVVDYAYTIRDWNARWAYPRLICSTNAAFWADLAPQLPEDLPVFRGELPGQDYPVGAMSTAAATGVNRGTHASLPAAEKLATVAAQVTDYPYPEEQIAAAYEEVLWHDEHTWGHHFPCGPTHLASELEKAVHAYRGQALSHDVTNRALARLADHVAAESDDFRLTVFNSSSRPRTGPVRTLLREIDNCGSTIAPVGDPGEGGHWRGVLLQDRWHAVLPPPLLEGRFDLVDLSTGQAVPYQIVELTAHDEPTPYAAQRLGIGSGGKRYGGMEAPVGLRRELCFLAQQVPACGYRTYRLVPQATAPRFPQTLRAEATSLENAFYRVEAEAAAGGIVSLYDKQAGRELVDPECPHPFLGLVVRDPASGRDWGLEGVQVHRGESGPVCVSLRLTGAAWGHPAVTTTVTLYEGLREVHVATRILKDSVPLLDAHLAFPFRAADPAFRYEGALAVMDPIRDYLPGAYSDALTVQNWVRVSEGESWVLWSSREAPVVSLGGLWPGYVSPAHRSVLDASLAHPPLRAEDLRRGWIYSLLFANNFGTNFSVTQAGEAVFRYVLTSGAGEPSDGGAALWGAEAADPLVAILAEKRREGHLPVSASFLEVDSEQVVLLASKRAEDGRGLILRLWNPGPAPARARVTLPHLRLGAVELNNLVEEDLGQPLEHGEQQFTLQVAPAAVATVRVREKE